MHDQSFRMNGESDTAKGGVRDGLASACNPHSPFAIWTITVDADDSVPRSRPCIIPRMICILATGISGHTLPSKPRSLSGHPDDIEIQ